MGVPSSDVQQHGRHGGLFKSLPYDTVNDFAPVSTLGFFDLAVLVAADSKIQSLQELIAQARASPARSILAPSTSAAPSIWQLKS